MTLIIGKLRICLSNPRKSWLFVIEYGTMKKANWFFYFHPYTFWPTCEGSKKSRWVYFKNFKS